jgi:hypothetical protein
MINTKLCSQNWSGGVKTGKTHTISITIQPNDLSSKVLQN